MLLTCSILRRALLLAIIASSIAGPALAQSEPYPSKPIRVLVPAAAGSAADFLARVLGDRFSRSVGQPWIVENRPGAGGMIGSDVVAKAQPDGYTLLFTANVFVISPSLYSRAPYDIHKDFTPVGLVATTPNFILVNAAKNVKSVAELVALAKRTPGGLDYGSPFIGTSAHLTMELFKRAAGINLNHIPTKGTPQAITEAMTGRVPVVIAGAVDALPHVTAGKLNAVAVTDARRSRLLPSVPTLSEAGYPGLDIPLWFALYAPANVSTPILERLNRELNGMLRAPDVVDSFTTRGFEPMPGSPKELEDRMRREQPLFAKIIAESGIKAE